MKMGLAKENYYAKHKFADDISENQQLRGIMLL
jgi:hypothetical protein